MDKDEAAKKFEGRVELSDSERKRAVAWVKRYAKNGCPMCGSKDGWSANEVTYSLVCVGTIHGDKRTRYMPLVMMFCRDCAHTSMFSASAVFQDWEAAYEQQ